MKKVLIFIFIFSLSCTAMGSTITSLKQINSPLDVPIYLLNSIQDSTKQKELYHFIVAQYAQNNQSDEAITLIESLPKSLLVLKKPLYLSFFIEYYKTHSATQVLELLAEISEKLTPYIIEACFVHSLDQKNISDALIFFDAIDSQIIKSRFGSLLVRYYVEQNNFKSALYHYDLIELPAEKEESLSYLAILHTKNRNITTINESLSMITNKAYRNDLLYNVTATLVSLDELEVALNFLEQIQEATIYEKALTHVIKKLIENDDLESALNYAQLLTTDFYKYEIMIDLGKAFAARANSMAINELLSNIDDKKTTEEFIKEVTLILARNNEIQMAFELSRTLPEKFQEAHLPTLLYNVDPSDNFHYLMLMINKTNNETIINKSLLAYASVLVSQENHDSAKDVITSISNSIIKQDCLVEILKNNNPLEIIKIYDTFFTESILISYVNNTAQTITDSNEALAMIELINTHIKSKSISKLDHFKIYLNISYLLTITNQQSYAINYAKKAHKLLKKLRYRIDYDLLEQYIQLETALNREQYALNVLNKTKKSSELLYLFKYFDSTSINSKKSLISFAKDFK
jgi:hypothetical protein